MHGWLCIVYLYSNMDIFITASYNYNSNILDLLCHTHQQHTAGKHIYTSTIVLPRPIMMTGGHSIVSMY